MEKQNINPCNLINDFIKAAKDFGLKLVIVDFSADTASEEKVSEESNQNLSTQEINLPHPAQIFKKRKSANARYMSRYNFEKNLISLAINKITNNQPGNWLEYKKRNGRCPYVPYVAFSLS